MKPRLFTSKKTYTFGRSSVVFPIIFLAFATEMPTLMAQSLGTFIATGSMATGRYGHSATLLKDGRVLIAGGFTDASGLFLGIPYSGEGRGVTATAELYDPATGEFTPTGNMTAARAYHTAMLLQDGRVLIASGTGMDRGPGNLASSELYDPSTGTFTAGDGSFTPTGSPQILLPNGKVLVAGGNDDPGPSDAAELYDPSTGTFVATGKMTVPRSHLTISVLLDGKALIAGGGTWTEFSFPGGGSPGLGYGCCLNSVELYDPDTGVFTAAGRMRTSRAGHTATVLQSGQVFIVGGSGGVAVDPATLGQLFLSGRFLGGAVALATAELYTPPQASVPTSWVQVISKNSGKCLDVTGGPSATDPGTPLLQWSCWGGSNQAFRFTSVEGGYQITAQNSGLQLDVTGGPEAVQDGIHVIQWPYWGGSNEIWQVQPVADGHYKIVALNSGKCLDVDGISLSDGAPVQQWSCWGGDNQSWQLVPIP